MRTTPLKRIAAINQRALPEDTDPARDIRYIDISSVGRGELVATPEAMTFGSAPSRARRLVQPGDTIVSTVRTYLRAVWPVSDDTKDLVVSTGFAVVTPHAVDARYLSWWIRSDTFIEEVVARSVGVSYPAINSSELGDLKVRVPGLAQQRAIADFLETETARIDALITKKRRMLVLLEERVDSRVRVLIGTSPLFGGRGLEAVPLRRVLSKQERWSNGGEMVTAFRDGEVTRRSARGRDGFTNVWTDNGRVQRVEVGDVVVHGLDGFSGAIGDAQLSGVCSPIYHVCRARDGDGAFYGRLLRILAIDGYLGGFATSTRERAVDFRNWDLFGRIPVPRVSTDEQRRIGDDIRKIRPLRQRIQLSENLAVEHRQALITATVTGELAVPGVAA